MINPLNMHYAFNNPASIHDEEALTALELAGRQGAKINEIVNSYNELEADTTERLEAQDTEISNRLTAQDNAIENVRKITIPVDVTAEVQKQIDNGTFDRQIDETLGTLPERLDALIGNLSEGGTTMDAEVIDGRVRANGLTYENLGSATRSIDEDLQKAKQDASGKVVCHELMKDIVNWSNGLPLTEIVNLQTSITNNQLHYTLPPSEAIKNSGISTKLFDLNTDEKFYIVIDFECDRDSCLQLYLAGQHGFVTGKQQNYGGILAGRNVLEFDPKDYAFDIRCIWLVQNGAFATENTYNYVFNEISVYQNPINNAGLKGETGSDFIKALYELQNEDRNTSLALIGDNKGETVLMDDRHLNNYHNIWNDTPFKKTSALPRLIWTTLGDAGVVTPDLVIDTSKKLRIEFDIELATNTEYTFSVSVAETYDTSKGYKEISTIRESGHYEFEIDPAYYSVYHNVNVKRVWFLSHTTNTSGNAQTTILSNIKIYQNILKDNGYTGNVAEDIIAIGKASGLQKIDSSYLIAPNGSRYVTQVDNSGNFTAIPVVPKKALYLGNSLLFGFGFGMAASDNKHDYFYLMKEAIKTIEPDHTANKLASADWEACETIEAQNTWLNNVLRSRLTEDLELVVVQLGDNVNTEARQSVFAEGSKNLLAFIRQHCPKARVVWMGAWYQSQVKMDMMIASCKATGSYFVDIWDLHTKENESAVGNTYTKEDGTTGVIESAGVASHPGDLGFKAITNRMLYTLGIVDTEYFYE